MNLIGKIMLAVVLIAVVGVLVLGTHQLKENLQIETGKQNSYSARKEELVLQEQKLQILIESLNVTLEQQKARQEILISQLSDSEKQKLLAEQEAAAAKAAADAAAKAAAQKAATTTTTTTTPRKTRAS